MHWLRTRLGAAWQAQPHSAVCFQGHRYFSGCFFVIFVSDISFLLLLFAFALVLARLGLAVAVPSPAHPPTFLIVPTTPTITSASITQRSPIVVPQRSPIVVPHPPFVTVSLSPSRWLCWLLRPLTFLLLLMLVKHSQKNTKKIQEKVKKTLKTYSSCSSFTVHSALKHLPGLARMASQERSCSRLATL